MEETDFLLQLYIENKQQRANIQLAFRTNYKQHYSI